MQAIQTRYQPPKMPGARKGKITARCSAGRYALDCDLSDERNKRAHETAAMALARRLGWVGTLHGGALPGNGSGFAWVVVPIRCPCGSLACSGPEDGANHQCGGPREACGTPGCGECGRAPKTGRA